MAAAKAARRKRAPRDGEPKEGAPTATKRRRAAPNKQNADDVAERDEAWPACGSTGPPRAAAPDTSMFRKDVTFTGLGLRPSLVKNCEKMNILHPTEIQALALKPVLDGKNVAGNAKTGSGKTACFCLPILHHLSKDPYGVYALVLTPVRELAFQVAENFTALGRSMGVTVTEVVGGKNPEVQKKAISERVHVVVATPGRLWQLLEEDKSLKQAFRGLKTLVLDEADQLLTEKFEDHLAGIFDALPKTRQTLFFSATLTKSIEALAERIPNLTVVDANPNDDTLSNLTQQYVFVPRTVQLCYLHYLLYSHFWEQSCIIFAPTIEICELLATVLRLLDFPVAHLHSLQQQSQRQASLGSFRAGKTTILVATDVAARGLDIPKVTTVINYGLPAQAELYIHRSGRTARAGRPGLVVSLMTDRDVAKVEHIEAHTNHKLEEYETNEEDAVKFLTKTTKASQQAELLLSENGFEQRAQRHRELRQRARESRW